MRNKVSYNIGNNMNLKPNFFVSIRKFFKKSLETRKKFVLFEAEAFLQVKFWEETE